MEADETEEPPSMSGTRAAVFDPVFVT